MAILGYDFDVLYEPPSPEDVTVRKSTATRTYLGPWDQRWDFATDVLGKVTVLDGPPVLLRYTQPLAYPDRPGLYAMRCAMEGFGEPVAVEEDGNLAYSHALVTVTYETPEYPVEGDQGEAYLTVSLRSSSEFITMEGAYKFASGQVVPAPVGILVPSIDFSIQARRLPGILDAWFDYAGMVNSVEFQGRPAGTVLYKGAEVDVALESTNELRYAGAFSLGYRRIEWNKDLNPYTGNFELLTTVTGGNPKYPSADLNELFTG